MKKHAEEGSTLVEFALVVPVLLFLIFVIIEIGFILFIKTGLQAGVTAGARFCRQNAATGGNTVAAITSAILQQVNVNPSSVTVTIQYYPNFAAISGSNPSNLSTINPGTVGGGSPGNAVMFQASYTYTSFTGFMSAIMGSSKTLTAVTYGKN